MARITPKVVPNLPASARVAIVIILHRPAEARRRTCRLPVAPASSSIISSASAEPSADGRIFCLSQPPSFSYGPKRLKLQAWFLPTDSLPGLDLPIVLGAPCWPEPTVRCSCTDGRCSAHQNTFDGISNIFCGFTAFVFDTYGSFDPKDTTCYPNYCVEVLHSSILPCLIIACHKDTGKEFFRENAVFCKQKRPHENYYYNVTKKKHSEENTPFPTLIIMVLPPG